MLDRIIYEYKYLKNNIDRLTEMLLRIDTVELIKNCCFYYSCGADITPIIALKDEINSFIYCDAHTFWGYPNYDEKIFKMKTALRENNFVEIQNFKIDLEWIGLQNKTYVGGTIYDQRLSSDDFLGEFSLWKNENKFYFLTYISWDNTALWDNLFLKNKISPMAICNFLNETGIPIYNEDGKFNINENPKYILGYNYSSEYALKEKVKYFGHWSDCETIDMFELNYEQ
jgi:hypothetical protein